MVPGDRIAPRVRMPSACHSVRDEWPREEDSFALWRRSARGEGLGLYRMLNQDGNTIEMIREMIAVPPRIEQALRAFARAHPEEAHSIGKHRN